MYFYFIYVNLLSLQLSSKKKVIIVINKMKINQYYQEGFFCNYVFEEQQDMKKTQATST